VQNKFCIAPQKVLAGFARILWLSAVKTALFGAPAEALGERAACGLCPHLLTLDPRRFQQRGCCKPHIHAFAAAPLKSCHGLTPVFRRPTVRLAV
jgi:hypothetical protein